eukprot:TRINITY_DN21408_c0_g1_i1.p1 TRINITY_DN21408_c0_g1~~TRINITY_DN21408_c0_g1_i1.p1  ORF type:complete len:654 (-),score=159.16 TRINITY_DN21408_c0_g1_i1:34-1968(-)
MDDPPQDPEGAEEPAEEAASVPPELSLFYFLQREELCDCVVQLPPRASASEVPAEEIKCHKLALCSFSGYFFRRFVLEGETASVELPPLPEDEELRRQLDVHSLFPLALRYAYAGQKWEALAEDVTANNCTGLYALAMLLKATSLAREAFEFFEMSALTPATAARLLYLAVQLQAGNEALAAANERCMEVVRLGFEEVYQSPPDMSLLCMLPVDVLAPLLEADDLEVRKEGTVLEAVRRILWRRMPREERQLTVKSARLCDAGSLPAGIKLAGELEDSASWTLLVLDEPPVEIAADLGPQVSKYAASTPAGPLSEPNPGEGIAIQELSVRFPAGSVGPGRRGALLLRAMCGMEVILCALLPTDQLPQELGLEAEEELEAQALLPDGNPAGTVKFRWMVADAPPPEAAEETPAEAEGEAPSAVPDSPLTGDEVSRVLACVRFPHLEHGDLLRASKDSLLQDAGAQPQVLAALSARLAQYEAADGETFAGSQAPRPSTQKGQKGGRGPISKVMSGPMNAPSPPPPPPEVTMVSTMGAAAGVSLFACPACQGKGSLKLQQVGTRWVARCVRQASCQNVIYLPSCIVAAAPDGHCAACALRLGCEVRTLTIRIGRDQTQSLRKLPGGHDTLRGVCIAGCNDTLSMLGS